MTTPTTESVQDATGQMTDARMIWVESIAKLPKHAAYDGHREAMWSVADEMARRLRAIDATTRYLKEMT